MAEETKTTAESTAPAAVEEVVVVPNVPVTEHVEATVEVTEKELPPEPEPVPEPEKKEETVVEEEVKAAAADEEKIAESASFKEETNVVGELPDRQKIALDELKQLIQEALNKNEFTTPPPPPPPAKEDDKPAEAAAAAADEGKSSAPAAEEEAKPAEKPDTPAEAVSAGDTPAPASEEPPKIEPEVVVKPSEVADAPAAKPSEPVVVAIEKAEKAAVEDDGAKTVEAIEETIVAVAPAATEVPPPAEEASSAPPPPPPEVISIWGIPLLADERSDVILLKFLRARDFKVKEAFSMLKSVVAWRKEFKIETLIEEDLGTEQEKAVFIHGVDKEGHPVCYNVYGEYQNKELYQNTFADEEKRTKFLKWRIQFLEKSIRKLDFSPDGICTFVQVIDLKNSPSPFQSNIRLANRAFQLFQDNYPEFVAKQIFINVPWWYLTFYKMINKFFTTRTKSKFVFAGPSKTADALFKYIAPEHVPMQYGGLSREGEQEFTTVDSVTEEIIKPASKHAIEFPISETCNLVWEARVVGWDVSYGAEFTPAAEGGYTVIVQKTRKVGYADEPVISSSFKIGEPGKIVLAFDNQTSKKKKLLYRSKIKPSE